MNDVDAKTPAAGMTAEQMERANLARLRRDYRELTPEQRVKQVAELPQQASRNNLRNGD